MLNLPPSHAGPPPTPDDLWNAWNLDPIIVASLLVIGLIYWSGWNALHRGSGSQFRKWCFILGLLAIGLALVSPLDAMSSALASAHMTQHMLLVAIAAPLIAVSRPLHSLRRGTENLTGVFQSREGRTSWPKNGWPNTGWPNTGWYRSTMRLARLPVVALMLHTLALWIWHASVPYEAALGTEALHIFEHATFLGTALLFWSAVVRTHNSLEFGWGLGVLMVFAMMTQSTILAALMTFSRTPWYGIYANSTTIWGLGHLADQQLAAVIMWIPSGMIYVAASVGLMRTWIKGVNREGVTREGASPGSRSNS